MPFTPAHPAIVLPLLRIRQLSATGLIIGSMTPDFEYFIKFSVNSKFSHTWPGVFYFDVPVGLLLSILFHQIVKHNLISNLPTVLKLRFQTELTFNFSQHARTHWFVLCLSIVIGASSHLFWDAFTHGDGYFVHELPFYQGAYIPFDGVRYPLFYVLQHTSTVVGIIGVMLAIWFRPISTADVSQTSTIRYWMLIILLTLAVVLLRFFIFSFDYNIGNVVVSSISGLCIALLITGLLPFHKSSS